MPSVHVSLIASFTKKPHQRGQIMSYLHLNISNGPKIKAFEIKSRCGNVPVEIITGLSCIPNAVRFCIIGPNPSSKCEITTQVKQTAADLFTWDFNENEKLHYVCTYTCGNLSTKACKKTALYQLD